MSGGRFLVGSKCDLCKTKLTSKGLDIENNH